MGDKRVEAIGRKAMERDEKIRSAARGDKSMAAHERSESKSYEAHEKPFKQAQYEGNAGETDKPAEMTMRGPAGFNDIKHVDKLHNTSDAAVSAPPAFHTGEDAAHHHAMKAHSDMMAAHSHYMKSKYSGGTHDSGHYSHSDMYPGMSGGDISGGGAAVGGGSGGGA